MKLKEVTVATEDDTQEWAVERLKVLARLTPYRLVRYAIKEKKPVVIEDYFDHFDCAALFIDISGFSKITEILFAAHGLEGAEELATHLNINLGKCVQSITRCGGDVIKFAGDAALCVFQAGSRAELAKQTLLATQLSLDCIAELERDNYVVEGVRLTAHSGIGVGPVTGFMAGGIFKRSEYAIIGEPIFQVTAAHGQLVRLVYNIARTTQLRSCV
jgi:class 3 adenylate cyclase